MIKTIKFQLKLYFNIEFKMQIVCIAFKILSN